MWAHETKLVAHGAAILPKAQQSANELCAEYSGQDTEFKEVYNNRNVCREGMRR